MTQQTIHQPVRIGLVGLGRAGWGMHCSELESRKDKFQIIAACDVEPERRNRMQQRYGCKTYACLADLLADPQVELVDIATRSPDHVTHATAALQAGKDVFLEKPIALSYDQAEELHRVAQSAGGQLWIRHNRRFEPAFVHIRQILDSGVLGDVFEIKLRRHNFQRRDDWQAIIACGGGQLLNWGPHIIDHGLRLLDSPLQSMWSDLKQVAALGDAEDHLKIILKGENGRIVDLEISGGAAIPEPEYLIFGSRGALSCDGKTIRLRRLDPSKQLLARKASAATPRMEGVFGDPNELVWLDETFPVAPVPSCDTDSIWDHLYAAIRENRQFPISLNEALEVMRVVSQAKQGTAFEQKVASSAVMATQTATAPRPAFCVQR